MTYKARLKATLECDPVRMCEILIGLPAVDVIGLDASAHVLKVHVECQRTTVGCPSCGVVAHVKDQRPVRFVDLPVAGRPMALVWHKRRLSRRRLPHGVVDQRQTGLQRLLRVVPGR